MRASTSVACRTHTHTRHTHTHTHTRAPERTRTRMRMRAHAHSHLKLHEVDGPCKLEAELLRIVAETRTLPSDLRQRRNVAASQSPESQRDSSERRRAESRVQRRAAGQPSATTFSLRTHLHHGPRARSRSVDGGWGGGHRVRGVRIELRRRELGVLARGVHHAKLELRWHLTSVAPVGVRIPGMQARAVRAHSPAPNATRNTPFRSADPMPRPAIQAACTHAHARAPAGACHARKQAPSAAAALVAGEQAGPRRGAAIPPGPRARLTGPRAAAGGACVDTSAPGDADPHAPAQQYPRPENRRLPRLPTPPPPPALTAHRLQERRHSWSRLQASNDNRPSVRGNGVKRGRKFAGSPRGNPHCSTAVEPPQGGGKGGRCLALVSAAVPRPHGRGVWRGAAHRARVAVGGPARRRHPAQSVLPDRSRPARGSKCTRSMGDGSGMAASSVRGWHTQRGHYSGVLPGHRRCAGQLPPRAARGSGDRRACPALPRAAEQQAGRCPPCRLHAVLARTMCQRARCGGCVHPLRGGRDVRRAARRQARARRPRATCQMHAAGARCARSAAPSLLNTDARKHACFCACGRCWRLTGGPVATSVRRTALDGLGGLTHHSPRSLAVPLCCNSCCVCCCDFRCFVRALRPRSARGYHLPVKRAAL